MKEVSCRAFGIYFREMKRKKIPAELLVVGTDLTVAHLQNASERVDWDQFRVVMANCAKIWSDEELIGLGGAFFRDPRMAPLSLIARVLFDARDFYAWMCKERDGAGQILFACVRSSFRDTGRDKCEIQLTMHEGYAPCREFLLVSLGSMRDGPRILMLSSAKVEMHDEGTRCTFSIDIPKGGGLLRRIRKFFLAPFTGHAIARELSSANAVLEERYQLLEGARQQLANQATQLRIANQVSQLIHANLDLERTLKTITEALVTVAAVDGARIDVAYASRDGSLERTATYGRCEASIASQRIDLQARGVALGTLHLWKTALATADGDDLIRAIVPSICMALDESIAFTLLDQYRNTLEQRVLERTVELQAAQVSLTRTVEDLEEAQKVRNRIFANINHEIRTPLSLVLLSAGEIRNRRENQNDKRTLASVSHIEAACERLLSMVDSMLLLAAGQEGKLGIQRRVCDLAIEARRTVSIWQPLASQNNLTLTYSGPERCEAYLDTAALERILANLLSNAIKYTPDKGSIELSVEESAHQLILRVRDTGIGLDEEFKKRIFGRFEQGRAAVRHGARSSGIGLAIVKELVEAHGGNASVGNNPGGGTVFNVVFPRVAPSQTPEALPPSASVISIHSLPAGFGLNPVDANEPAVLSPPDHALATILVAEDDSGLRASIGDLLLTHGYKVLLAVDGFSALRMASEHFPDMLVSDVGMPGMDGLELSRRFRDLPGNRLAPTLLLTAFGTVSDKMSGFDAGAIDYVTKPFEPRELLARISSQLKLRELALKLSRSEKLASLGTMSAGLAHEMRNPANGLLNALDPLRSLLPEELLAPDAPAGQLLDVVRDCAEQIGRLSRQLLGFKGTSTVVTSEENVGQLVRRSLSMVDPKTAGVKVLTLTDYEGSARVAAPLMMQVIVNLLDNAMHAAGRGGTVEVRSYIAGDRLTIDVRDSGPGVPSELRERIFEPFFTTKGPGAGTGLGLSTSRQIVEQHQGTLRVVEGNRSTFRIDIPLNGPSNVSVAMDAVPQRKQAAS